MYAYIKGKLIHKDMDYIILEANNIGYKIFSPYSTVEKTNTGDEIKVFTHLHVREDAMLLYGFLSQEELNIFELLISVTGVGPKAAIAIISSVSPSKFGLAVITDDVNTLTKAQGIGKKIAQRIILELKDKIKKEQLQEVNKDFSEKIDVSDSRNAVSEAVSALVVLGYSPFEANKVISQIHSEEMDVETIIKNALKNLAKNT